jgi:hypothetical protein
VKKRKKAGKAKKEERPHPGFLKTDRLPTMSGFKEFPKKMKTPVSPGLYRVGWNLSSPMSVRVSSSNSGEEELCLRLTYPRYTPTR